MIRCFKISGVGHSDDCVNVGDDTDTASNQISSNACKMVMVTLKAAQCKILKVTNVPNIHDKGNIACDMMVVVTFVKNLDKSFAAVEGM